MSTKPFFSTLIYYQDLLDRDLSKFNSELLVECHQIRDFDQKGHRWSKKHYIGGYTSYASLPQLHQFSSTFAKLESWITRHVKNYIAALNYDMRGRQVGMTDCWLNIMPAQVAHGLHIHPNSFISGTYYVSTPKDCAAIKFEDPRLPFFMHAPPKKQGLPQQSQTFVSFPAKAGKLVLFESWLRHEVPAALNRAERISISFNYNWW